MKRKFVLGSKILLGLFVYLFIIFLAYALSEDSRESNFAIYVVIPLIIVTVLMLVSFSVMFVCEVIELIKERNWKALLDFPLHVIGITIVSYFGDIILKNTGGNLRWYLLLSVGMACFIKILNYCKRAKRESQ